MTVFADPTETGATPIEQVPADQFPAWRDAQSALVQAWLEKNGFKARAGQFVWLPDASGAPQHVAVGGNGRNDLAALGELAWKLPEGLYAAAADFAETALIGFGLGAYRFTRYKNTDRKPARLVIRDAALRQRVESVVSACSLARDLINTGADDLLPSALAAEVLQTGARLGATVDVVTGDALLTKGYRTIHAVGRAADDPPCLIDLRWGNPASPRLTLVGKGVCFDSGGLDLKPASGMRSMKKDMGGAAIALGLAQLIMTQRLPVRLRLLIPAVENAISGNAYRPGDVIRTYAGTTVEIDNTDAEGRLILCDALALAIEETPDLLIDFATLTGAARSAVGAEISAMFATSDKTAEALYASGAKSDDPVWRLPLHAPYEDMLRSSVADVVNSPSSPYGGAITAALFLKKFTGSTEWVHFDTMAYNTRSRPGRPEGGEAMGLRAVFNYLQERYGTAA
ncbi:MAG: leucyl aminopeptidase family protein [Gammaproteobacteria bacterium]|nr:leucyl aminopeptidase family protein [Gammaproteobacteria bacterium]